MPRILNLKVDSRDSWAKLVLEIRNSKQAAYQSGLKECSFIPMSLIHCNLCIQRKDKLHVIT